MVRVRVSVLLTVNMGRLHIHGKPFLVQRLMEVTYFADAAIWESYGVASAMLSLFSQLVAAYELECCN